jgi:hypothetical protein
MTSKELNKKHRRISGELLYTEGQLQEINRLSRTHTPKQIATILQVSYSAVIQAQNNPANGILNPKRETTRKPFKRDRTPPAKGCFDYNNPKNFF